MQRNFCTTNCGHVVAWNALLFDISVKQLRRIIVENNIVVLTQLLPCSNTNDQTRVAAFRQSEDDIGVVERMHQRAVREERSNKSTPVVAAAAKVLAPDVDHFTALRWAMVRPNAQNDGLVVPEGVGFGAGLTTRFNNDVQFRTFAFLHVADNDGVRPVVDSAVERRLVVLSAKSHRWRSRNGGSEVRTVHPNPRPFRWNRVHRRLCQDAVLFDAHLRNCRWEERHPEVIWPGRILADDERVGLIVHPQGARQLLPGTLGRHTRDLSV
mmetsp:Transcript_109302/g.265621  ORF Transcript_109302/g.265621 Transcript_109302/m.265621 type:complete len:268 (+) Transcript_109302:3030-3833(+)